MLIHSDPARPLLLSGALLAAIVLPSIPARSEPESAVPACYVTGGGGLEICRSAGEPEGVYFVAPPCRLASEVQILRLQGRTAPGPLQVVHDAEPRTESRTEVQDAPRRTRRETRRRRIRERGEERAGAEVPANPCAAEPGDPSAALGHSVRSGRQVEALATTMPPTDFRFWTQEAREEPRRGRRRYGRRARQKAREAAEQARDPGARDEPRPPAAAEAGIARSPMTVAGRDWAGDDYFYVFMVGAQDTAEGRRHVLIQGRTYDFEGLDLRARSQGADDPDWLPFGAQKAEEGESRRGRRSRRSRRATPPPSAPMPAPAPVLDEAGKPVMGNCTASGGDPRGSGAGLSGSISVVDRVYHYFYTDVLASECNEPPAKRRVGLYLRKSRDLTEEKVWSAATIVVEGLPAETAVRVAKAKAMDRWAVAYSCFRPALAQGGPVADICLHYTKDLSIGAIAGLTFFSEPVSAVRSTAYLGLRSGGDASGRYGREGFSWMTDRYGNLDTPAIYTAKGGFLTWTDPLVRETNAGGPASPSGHPVYWATWTVQPR